MKSTPNNYETSFLAKFCKNKQILQSKNRFLKIVPSSCDKTGWIELVGYHGYVVNKNEYWAIWNPYHVILSLSWVLPWFLGCSPIVCDIQFTKTGCVDILYIIKMYASSMWSWWHDTVYMYNILLINIFEIKSTFFLYNHFTWQLDIL